MKMTAKHLANEMNSKLNKLNKSKNKDNDKFNKLNTELSLNKITIDKKVNKGGVNSIIHFDTIEAMQNANNIKDGQVCVVRENGKMFQYKENKEN